MTPEEEWLALPNIEERFWARVDKTGDCWLWRGAPTTHGYGFFHYTLVKGRHRNVLAHRVAYSLEYGSIPPGKFLDHRCRNRLCVRPSHLRPATCKENMENRGGAEVTNKCGVRGVYYDARDGRKKPWRARVMHNRKFVEAGQFATLEEAAEAARLKRLELFTHSDADREAS